ncbi:MAG: HD-GYP domain-containing protein [Rubrobacteraceae bacterium]
MAGLVLYSVDILTNATLLRLKYGAALVQTLREEFLPIVPSSVAAIFAALGTAYALVVFGPAATLVLFVGAAGALVSLHLIHGRQKENEALKAENANLLSSNVVFAGRLIESLGAKDGYTDRHATASTVYAEDTAKEFGLETERVEKLKVAALLQNVGLVGVPDEVLLNPSAKLNSVGRVKLESHPVQGERILSSVPEFEEAAKWVRWHHERPDGTGYPDRLRDKWIPLEAKVLAVSETDASLILDSPHSPGIPLHDARRQLVGLAGQGLDREVVRTFLRVLDSKDPNYAAAIDDRFTFPTSVEKEFASQ